MQTVTRAPDGTANLVINLSERGGEAGAEPSTNVEVHRARKIKGKEGRHVGTAP